MSDIRQKLEDYLNDNETLDDFLPDEDAEMMDRMIDFIMNLDTENLTEDQVDEVVDIIDQLDATSSASPRDVPVPIRMASNSVSVNDAGPTASSRSRGRSGDPGVDGAEAVGAADLP